VKTERVKSKNTKSRQRVRPSHAKSEMSLTDLQLMAKSRGIPFGGLTKTKLARRINNYENYI
jgi:hypothetical protein